MKLLFAGRTFAAIRTCRSATRSAWPNWAQCATAPLRVPSSRTTDSAPPSPSLTNWATCKYANFFWNHGLTHSSDSNGDLVGLVGGTRRWDLVGLVGGTWWDFVVGLDGTCRWDLVMGLGGTWLDLGLGGIWLWDLVGLNGGTFSQQTRNRNVRSRWRLTDR